MEVVLTEGGDPGFPQILDRFKSMVLNSKDCIHYAFGSPKASSVIAAGGLQELEKLGWRSEIHHKAEWHYPGATPPRTSPHGPIAVIFEHNGDHLLITEDTTSRDHAVHMNLLGHKETFQSKWASLMKWVESYPCPENKPNDTVPIEFYHMTHEGPRAKTRFISAPYWDRIRQNYAAEVQESLDQLSKTTLKDQTDSGGKVVLLHGEPGTGKTTFLRSLARSWQDWATTTYVIDPDELFARSEYLYHVLSDAPEMDVPERNLDSGEERPQKWKVLILEDVDEFIGDDAKRKTGQAFSRLLNTADGFIGQGLKILIVLTTNISIDKVAPALIRPGRCLSKIEVPPIPAKEAQAWLGDQKVTMDLTLASLYERKSESHQIVSEHQGAHYGKYL